MVGTGRSCDSNKQSIFFRQQHIIGQRVTFGILSVSNSCASNFFVSPILSRHLFKSLKFQQDIQIQGMPSFYNLSTINKEVLMELEKLPANQKYKQLAILLYQIRQTGDQNLMMLEDNLEQCDNNVFGYLKIMETIRWRRRTFCEFQFVLTREQRAVREKTRKQKRLKRSRKSYEEPQKVNFLRFLPELIAALMLVILNCAEFYEVSALELALSLSCVYLFGRLGETQQKVHQLDSRLTETGQSSEKKFKQIADQAKKLKPIEEDQKNASSTTQN